LPTRASARSAQSRRDLQIVLQDPYDSLDPAMTVAATVAEGLDIHGIGPWAGRRDRAARMLLEVGLDGAFLDRWPHELSGGQRQRVAIARALAVEPRVLVLDEPTSALDLSVQAQILNLLLQIQERRGIACLLISHDIDVIRHLCHRVYVMQAGRVVEEGPASMVLTTPCEPYTRRLIDSVPRLPAALGDAAWTGRATC
jgi:peptide/nickel transport system ATP-binding protein